MVYETVISVEKLWLYRTIHEEKAAKSFILHQDSIVKISDLLDDFKDKNYSEQKPLKGK